LSSDLGKNNEGGKLKVRSEKWNGFAISLVWDIELKMVK
jgi:hypothetical protein